MKPMTDAEFNRLVSFIKKNFGIELAKKRVLVEGRLGSIMREGTYASYTDYFDKVLSSTSSDDVVILMNKLTTNHTFFMREIEHFNYFKETVLPHFEKTIKDKDVRIWSAACSSGEEPYSFAMLIDDHFGSAKSQWDTKILCTDISAQAMAKAKAGIYANETLKDLPAAWVKKYFVDVGSDQSQIIPRLRGELVFKTFNLMDKITYKKPYDIIICRNVMIYFDRDTKHALVERFYDATKPGGFLFIGHSESLERGSTRYSYVKPAIFRKQ